MSIYILGINSVYHEPAACLIKDGEIVAAAEEERFNRIRHGKAPRIDNPHILPTESIKYCLKEGCVSGKQIDYIGFSFNPELRLAKNVGLEDHVKPYDWGSEKGEKQFFNLLKTVPEKISRLLETDIISRFKWIEHHLCHAASCYFPSPFEEAAILSTDGIGEFTTIWMGIGKRNEIHRLKEIAYPHSIGFLWTKMSRFLGFTSSGYGEYGAGKIMGLSAFGNPNKYYKTFRKFIDYDLDGNFWVDKNYLQFRVNDHSAFEKLFGRKRIPDEPIDKRHCDIAAGLQRITNESLLALANYLYNKTKCNNICRAGGVAINCISNQ